MRRFILSVLLGSVAQCIPGMAYAVNSVPKMSSTHLSGTLTGYYQQLLGTVSGNWTGYGRLFTDMQSHLFGKMFLIVIIAFPVAYLLHLLIVGAKKFSHDGPEILFFGGIARLIHVIAAIAFSLLVITGLMTVFASVFGGGPLVRFGRYIHIGAAVVFAADAVLMLIMWVKDMLPMPHDIAWVLILGGYLSKKKKPVPAGKFNAGQKMWFWLATAGGVVMAYTGYYLYSLEPATDTIRLYAIIHNILGAVLVAFFVTHLYMSIFAIKGSLKSMITGYKPKEEVDILHSLYRYE